MIRSVRVPVPSRFVLLLDACARRAGFLQCFLGGAADNDCHADGRHQAKSEKQPFQRGVACLTVEAGFASRTKVRIKKGTREHANCRCEDVWAESYCSYSIEIIA